MTTPAEEFYERLRGYTPAQMRAILMCAWVYDDTLLARAEDAMRNAPAPLPAGHGENHIDNAGHATLACDGQCHPDTCVECGARKEQDGSHYTRSGAHIAAVTA